MAEIKLDGVEERSSKAAPWHWVLLFLCLIALAWVARYWFSSGFGLYEDDLTFIPGAIDSSFGEILRQIDANFSTIAEQGRPFMWSWVILLSHMGWQLGGLQGMYVLAFCVWAVNIGLFVWLLKRVQGELLFCFIGGLAYVLFSADNTQAFLFNAFGLQSALTLLLIALHLYITKGNIRWLAYPFVLAILFNYETPFWLFLAAPCLLALDGPRLRKWVLINTLLLMLIFFSVFLLRRFSGEARVAELGFPEMILTPLSHMVVGPFVALGAYFLRAYQVAVRFSPGLGAAAAAFTFLSAGLGLWWVKEYFQAASSLDTEDGMSWWSALVAQNQRLLQLALAGLIMVFMAYPLTFLLRPTAISGRETRVHLAAVVGTALLTASAFVLLLRLIKKRGIRMAVVVGMCLLFGFNFAFGFLIQADFVQAWDLQQQFWRDLLPLIPDVEDGTIIMIEPTGLEDTLYMSANTWNLPRMLPQMFVFPSDWEQVPRVFRLVENWQNYIMKVPGYYTIDGDNAIAPPALYAYYPQEKAIFISTSSGELVRRVEPLPLAEMIPLRPISGDFLFTLETRPLYDLLILDE